MTVETRRKYARLLRAQGVKDHPYLKEFPEEFPTPEEKEAVKEAKKKVKKDA